MREMTYSFIPNPTALVFYKNFDFHSNAFYDTRARAARTNKISIQTKLNIRTSIVLNKL